MNPRPNSHEDIEWTMPAAVLLVLIAIAVTYLIVQLAPSHGTNENAEVLHNLVWPH